jgi:DNA-binding NarL/FixJ family response regulator
MSRAQRLLADLPRCRVHGVALYLLSAFDLDMSGDPGPAAAAALELDPLAQETGDPLLSCFTLTLRGMAAIRSGDTLAGFAALDEAMLPVLAGKIDAIWAGDIYCTTIHLCGDLGDLARMRKWTESLASWAVPLSESFMYVAVTRVHELQLIAAEGGWDVVEAELGRQSDSLIGAHGWLTGTGYYELGEVRRLRGDAAGAAAAFRRAREFGHDAQPGSALLLRAAGRSADALSDLRVALSGGARLERAGLLLPAVELALETADRGAAAGLAAELEETATYYGTPGLIARAAQARAALALDDGRPDDALEPLQRAGAIYREQRYRYASAVVHEQLARAHRALGRTEIAEAEEATAKAIYERLGARPDLERLAPRVLPGGLTAREAEVLARVAAGASNRDVAQALVISDKTIGRHLANIYAKTGVTSRTAAAAWARDHGIDPIG